jgi:tetratricopeptide (TPR) repeat protein
MVQLPFQIPTWKKEDMSKSIEYIITKGLEGSNDVDQFNKEEIKKLIVDAALDTKGYILLKMGKPGEARPLMERAAELQPNYTKYKHLEKVCKELGDDDSARKYREEAEKSKRK